MQKTLHNRPGRFDTSPGVCFIKPDLPYILMENARVRSLPTGNNHHPFLIISETSDSVECVLTQTLECPREYKNRLRRLNRPENYEIRNTYPPLDPNHTPDPDDRRRQYVDTKRVIEIPKKILFDATDLEICGDGRQKLNETDVINIKNSVNRHTFDINAVYNAPWSNDRTNYDLSAYREQRLEHSNTQNLQRTAQIQTIATNETENEYENEY